jgi:uncharacterized protein
MNKYKNTEFIEIIEPILNNVEFNELKNITHHGITRFEHCIRVAYYTYITTKCLHLNYREATEAALLHDFFTLEVVEENSIRRLRKHPDFAVSNALKYYDLSDLQIDIIKTHMFPITFTPPKYLESWIVDLVDDVSAIFEKVYSTKRELSAATTFLFMFLVNIIKIK